MYWRIASFLLFQAVSSVTAWFLASSGQELFAALAMALVGAYLWVALDVWRGGVLLRWLRTGDTTDTPTRSGLWGEVAERVRKLARTKERALQESDQRLQDFLAALQASPNGVVLLDADGRIEWFNQTAAAHFGFVVQRDLLQHFGNLVRDPGFASYYSTRDFSGDVVMPGRAHSSSKPVKLSVRLHPYGEGRNLLLSRDITAVEQADAMRRDFVANVSHEIRTPLTVLAGFVETLQNLPLKDHERQRYLALMAQQAERMQTLVSDLLMLSRLEGSPLPPVQDWVSVKLLMEQCRQEANDLSMVLCKREQDIDFVLGHECELAGSHSELHSAMFNLIGNAIRYTPPDKSIQVSWRLMSDGSAVFTVEDQGLGIAPEHLPRLTERFYRVDRSRSRETGGTGLGLAIVKHVAQRHGAELGIVSTRGSGSIFSITFPASRVRQSAITLRSNSVANAV